MSPICARLALSLTNPIKVMATRASIIFKEGGRTLAAIYKHYDGYPEGLGAKLKEIIAEGEMVNGCLPGDELGKRFNGAGCLFATVINRLKRTVGDVYICHPDDAGHQGEDYLYEVDERGAVTWRRYDGAAKQRQQDTMDVEAAVNYVKEQVINNLRHCAFEERVSIGIGYGNQLEVNFDMESFISDVEEAFDMATVDLFPPPMD